MRAFLCAAGEVLDHVRRCAEIMLIWISSVRRAFCCISVRCLPMGGIGDLGPAAHEFVEFLAAAKQHVWQVLPLCPTGYGNSPYAALVGICGESLPDQPGVPGGLGLDRTGAHRGPGGSRAATWISSRWSSGSFRCCMRRRAIFSIAARTIRNWRRSGSEFEDFCRAERAG